jgi:hypothetical protein
VKGIRECRRWRRTCPTCARAYCQQLLIACAVGLDICNVYIYTYILCIYYVYILHILYIHTILYIHITCNIYIYLLTLPAHVIGRPCWSLATGPDRSLQSLSSGCGGSGSCVYDSTSVGLWELMKPNTPVLCIHIRCIYIKYIHIHYTYIYIYIYIYI